MKFTKTSVGGTIEILAADDFVTIPICVTETAAVPAGMPMTTAGKKVATTSKTQQKFLHTNLHM